MNRFETRHLLVITILLCGILGLSSCQQEGGDTAAEAPVDGVWGNGFKDLSPVVCRVGDIEITQQDLDLHFAELPAKQQAKYNGDDWKKQLLREMVDETLLANQALTRKMYLDPDVSRLLLSLRRTALVQAYRDQEIYGGIEATEEEIEAHYRKSRESFVAQPAISLRHIETGDRETADYAFEALQGTGREATWAYVCAEHSVNEKTILEAGSLGWVNEGGFVRFVKNGNELSEKVFNWEIGVHPPIKIADRWHVIEILARRNARQLSLNEVREQIKHILLPSLHKGALETHVDELRAATEVEFLGEYAPGQGRSVDEIFQLAVLANQPDRQLDLFDIVIEEFPDSEFVPKSLFMKANVYLDNWGDTRHARYLLMTLVREHPDSDLVEQSQYILDNMSSIDFSAPTSIQELQELAQ